MLMNVAEFKKTIWLFNKLSFTAVGSYTQCLQYLMFPAIGLSLSEFITRPVTTDRTITRMRIYVVAFCDPEVGSSRCF
jgi:hypothetical protein